MTTPPAPASPKNERRPDVPAPAVDAAPPVHDDAPLPLAGRVPPSAAAGRLDPRQILALQRAAGNGAATSLIQRSPTEAPARPALKRKAPMLDLEPLSLPDTIPDAIEHMPGLISALTGVIERHAERREATGRDPGVTYGEITAAILFTRDALFFFSASGVLYSIEDNLQHDIDPAKPAELPSPKFTMPDEATVLVSEPTSGRVWRVFEMLGKARPGAGEDEEPESKGLFLGRSDSKPALPSAVRAGVVLSIYSPGWIARGQGIQIGWKRELGPSSEAPKDPPKWAVSQLERALRLLKKEAPPTVTGAEEEGAGAGRQGAGPGGGGRDIGIGTGTAGKGVGASLKEGGAGRGREDRVHDRDKPDRLRVRMTKSGPVLQVEKNGGRESLPMKPGEDDASLKKRIEEAAARQRSTGKLADAAQTTTIGGEGGRQATRQEILEATGFTANAPAYPSSVVMQGGSGAEVSPAGWATTVTGGRHNFDMILDWDARNFGLANQVFARLGFVDYYWQVIDVSRTDFGTAGSTQGPYETTEDFQQRMRQSAAGSGNVMAWKLLKQANLPTEGVGGVREATRSEGFTSKISRTASHKWEEAKEDWDGQAGSLAVIALDAAWGTLKSVISAWVDSMTEPENRREIEFGNPGIYVVRCLANPQPNKDAPPDKQTRRATSIGAFPVRVVNLDARAREVNRQEETQVDQLRALLAAASEELKKDPENEGLKKAVAMAQHELGQAEAAYAYSTVQKAEHELGDYDQQISVLEYLSDPKHSIDDVKGPLANVASQLKEDIATRLKRGPRGFVAWYDYEFHLHDVKEARAKKAELVELAKKKEGSVDTPISPRPRVTFVSEENGAIVKMEMILGKSRSWKSDHPRWTLADVTTTDTARSYDGGSEQAAQEGDAEAVRKAFQEFCDKAEYGRGTIAIDLPGHPELMEPGKVMLMKPGESARWKGRLKSLVEIASLVAPYVKGGQLLGRLAAIGGALEGAERLYDRAANDRLKANFETLADVVAVLGPIGHGIGSLTETRLLRATKTGYALQMFSKAGELANEFIMPASFLHDLDKILTDTNLKGPERDAAIVMLFGRGLKDGFVQYVKVAAPSRPTTAPVGGAPKPIEPVTTPVPHPAVEHVGPAEKVGPPEKVGPATTVPPVEGTTPARPSKPAPKPDLAPTAPTAPPKAAPKGVSRPAESDTLPGGVEGERPAQDLNIPADSPLNTPRGRRNRAEQLRRQAEHRVDERILQGGEQPGGVREEGTRPDARARARAADYAPLYARWSRETPALRRQHITDVVNAHLAREGIPPVKVVFGGKPPGHAEFAAGLWTIALSAEVINRQRVSADEFATLVDNAVHETQHTITTFRGIREAMARGKYNEGSAVFDGAVQAAKAANRRRLPEKELDQHARDEAFEIYEVQIDPNAPKGAAVRKGEVDRDAVLSRKDAANEAFKVAKAEYEVTAELARQNPKDADYQRQLQGKWAALKRAETEMIDAHNAYIALPEETVSWRGGSAAKQAVLERLAIMQRQSDAQREVTVAAAEARQKRASGDVKGAHDATRRGQEAQQRVRQAQADLAALTAKEPKLVGGRLTKRDMPLTDAEIVDAPRARPRHDDVGGGARKHTTAESSPLPKVEPQPKTEPAAKPDIAEVEGGGTAITGTPAKKGRPLVESARVPEQLAPAAKPAFEPNRPADFGTEYVDDIEAEPNRPASTPTAKYAPEAKDRYVKTDEKPVTGVSADQSFVVRDTADNNSLHLFKPLGSEKSIPWAEERGIKAGEQAPREVGASIAATELGVPTAKARLVTIDGVQGVLIEWHARNTLEDLRMQDPPAFNRLVMSEKFKQAMSSIDALDYLINNLDRAYNWGNYLFEFTSGGDLIITAIDHGLSFTSTKERAEIVGSTRGLPETYSSDLANRIRDLSARRNEFVEKIRPFVGDAAIPGVLHRLDALVADVNRKRSQAHP